MADGGDDQGLGTEVTDGDWGRVGFGKGAFSGVVEDRLGEESGTLDGEEGNMKLCFIRGHRFVVGMEMGGEEREAAYESVKKGQD